MSLSMTLSTLASKCIRHRRGALVGVIINEHTLDRAAARTHVDVLSRTFEFIHHDDLADRLASPGPRPFCLLTFDDGKRSGYTETADELERLGVPAVFYLATGFVGGDTPLWFDRYDALVAKAGAPPPGLEAHVVKALPYDILEARLDRACAEYDVIVDMTDDRIGPMRWEEARDMARRGFTIGAHGVRHSILTHEPEAQALREIEQSIADISRELGAPCRTFAFPNGNYTPRLAQHALACGVASVMTTEPTWVDTGTPLWRLPRVGLWDGQGRLRIELKLAVAVPGNVLVNPDGTGRLYWRTAKLREEVS